MNDCTRSELLGAITGFIRTSLRSRQPEAVEAAVSMAEFLTAIPRRRILEVLGTLPADFSPTGYSGTPAKTLLPPPGPVDACPGSREALRDCSPTCCCHICLGSFADLPGQPKADQA